MPEQIATVTVNGQEVPLAGEKNLLEVVAKAGITLPTFCYHSELSVYGACRMCQVEVDGRLAAACSTEPRPGMKIQTHTARVQRNRRMILELLLANHERECPTCDKNQSCQLQKLADALGVRRVRFPENQERLPLDESSPSLVRNPNKCILCGDCVRVCEEVQGIGVLDFAWRGSKARVTPAFGKPLGEVECVNCGQCASVCPTGAIVVKNEVDRVWAALQAGKTVIAQIAPAVRVAVGEAFGAKPGALLLGQMVAALKRLGFARVYDTSFTADLTVLEETHEFLQRLARRQTSAEVAAGREAESEAAAGGNAGAAEATPLPQFTSCCPAWIKYAEQYHPELRPHLSSCRSPQQMFGAVAKHYLTQELGVAPEELFVVSIMPCTAKKFEAARPEFTVPTPGGPVPEVDVVLTTQEFVQLVKEAGLDLLHLEGESLDLPCGLASGAGMIFGTTGGVAEAVLRTAAEMATGQPQTEINFTAVRGFAALKEATVTIGDRPVRVAVVHGLGNLKALLARLAQGEVAYDLVEVMACPGGCVGGGGQPVPNDLPTRAQRSRGLYAVDKLQNLRRAQDNPFLAQLYRQWLEKPGSRRAHQVLHTDYENRRRIEGDIPLSGKAAPAQLKVKVCVGTCCYLHGAYNTLQELLRQAEAAGLREQLTVEATFCLENCADSPSVQVGEQVYSGITPERVPELLLHIRRALS